MEKDEQVCRECEKIGTWVVYGYKEDGRDGAFSLDYVCEEHIERYKVWLRNGGWDNDLGAVTGWAYIERIETVEKWFR